MSILFWVFDVSMAIWYTSVIVYFVVRAIDIFQLLKYKIPFFELFTLIYFVDNVFALSLLKMIMGDSIRTGDTYYLAVDINEYLPFAFLSMQSILLGYNFIKISYKPIRDYIEKTDLLIERRRLIEILIVGCIGWLLQIFEIAALDFVSRVFLSFITCSIIAISLTKTSDKYIYIAIGFLLQISVAIRVGMFTEIIVFIIFILLFNLAKLIFTNSHLVKRSYLFLPLSVILLYIAFLSQHVKSEYRLQTWQNKETATTNNFNNVVSDQIYQTNPATKEFYLPLLFRLNQGYQVSQTMRKVPAEVPFQNGYTILRSIGESLLPRVLLPDKEEAGGKEKIAKYTKLKLTRSTSMNIGYLGESYVNFGKELSVVFFFMFGIFMAIVEKSIYNYSIHNPYILVFIPIILENFVGSGIDFLMLINSLIKTLVILIPVMMMMKLQNRYILKKE